MKLIAALVFSSILSIVYSEELVCSGEHEKLSEVTPPCPVTCASIVNPLKVQCLGVTLNEPSCQCSEGTARDTTSGKCVTREECLKTTPELVCDAETEHLSPTTPCHTTTCENRLIKGPICMSIMLKPSCQCNAGYVRSGANGKCVKTEACSAAVITPEPVCNAETEHLSPTTPCFIPNCQHRVQNVMCIQINVTKASCLCNTGTIRDTANGKCVKPEECSATAITPELVCDASTEHLSSTTPCHIPTCQNRNEKAICMSILMRPSCQCNAGTIRSTANGKCIAPEKCL
jgi:hypothetical protein